MIQNCVLRHVFGIRYNTDISINDLHSMASLPKLDNYMREKPDFRKNKVLILTCQIRSI